MPLVRTNARWIRAFLFGLAAEFSTIVTVVLVVTVHSLMRGGPMLDTTSRFAEIWGATIGIVGGAYYVYLYSRWIGSYLLRAFITHGLVVAVAAIALHLLTSIGTEKPFDLLHIGADAAKLLAGVVGGYVASKAV
jgi:hypothetical protein